MYLYLWFRCLTVHNLNVIYIHTSIGFYLTTSYHKFHQDPKSSGNSNILDLTVKKTCVSWDNSVAKQKINYLMYRYKAS